MKLLTDSDKLRKLADWFDSPAIQSRHPQWSKSTEIQWDLRRMATLLDDKRVTELIAAAEHLLNGTCDVGQKETRRLEAAIDCLLPPQT